MDDVSMTHLRGRLNAHRELLIEMMSLIMSDGGRVPAGAQGGPGDDLPVYDQEEDPRCDTHRRLCGTGGICRGSPGDLRCGPAADAGAQEQSLRSVEPNRATIVLFA